MKAKVTKKEIESVLRNGSVTEIIKVAKLNDYQIEGEHNVYDFILKYAPSNKSYKRATRLFTYRKCDKYDYSKPSKFISKKVEIVSYLRDQLTGSHNNYTKLPFLGHTHLYFCSPVYGHSDYNKWRAIEIKGNEAFVEAVLRYAHKVVNY